VGKEEFPERGSIAGGRAKSTRCERNCLASVRRCDTLEAMKYVPVPIARYRRKVFFGSDGQVYSTESGAALLAVSRLFAPSAADSRKALLNIRRKCRWSRAALAAVLGIPINTVRRWETGERRPNASAQRLIWLTEALTLHRERLSTPASFLSWGKVGCRTPDTDKSQT